MVEISPLRWTNLNRPTRAQAAFEKGAPPSAEVRGVRGDFAMEKRGYPGGCFGDLLGMKILPSYMGQYFISHEIRIPPINQPGFNGK